MTINASSVKMTSIDMATVYNKMESILTKNMVDLNKNYIIDDTKKITCEPKNEDSDKKITHDNKKGDSDDQKLEQKSESKKIKLDNKKKALDQESKKKKQPKRRILSLFLLGFVELLGGATLSLLAPFYSKEAEDKGLSVTASGTVFSSVFVMSIILGPFFGKYITKIGAVNMFVYGTIATGITNIMFAFLPLIESGSAFLGASLAIRLATAFGETACFTAVYPLAGERASEGSMSSVLGWMETMFGLGTTIGPFLGGLLYWLGGFYLPFMVCGVLLVICGAAAVFILDTPGIKMEEDVVEVVEVKYRNLVTVPSVMLGAVVLILTGVSTQWYQPSLEPYLRETFNLSSFQASLFFMVDGASYALVTPIWGLFLDRGFNSKAVLICGSSLISLSYVCLGLLTPSIVQVALSTALHGAGMAANFIATLTIMMSAAGKKVGGKETEQLRGMVTSIWMTCDSLGGFLGALGGGAAYDKFGWNWSCLMVALMHLCAVLLVSTVLACMVISRCKKTNQVDVEGRKGVEKDAREETGILNRGEGKKKGYGTMAQDVPA